MGLQYPRAAGNNNQPNGVYTPVLYSLTMLKIYMEQAMVPQIVNFNWEGEIKKFGDMVKIRRDPDAEVYDYVIGQDLQTQAVEDKEEQLLINKGVYYNVSVDDVDMKQNDVDWMSKFSENATKRTKLKVDTAVLGSVYADAPAANILPDRTVTPNNIPELIVSAGVALDESFCPPEDRYMVVPKWFKGHLQLNPNFNDADKMGDGKASILKTGLIGTLNGFDIFATSNLAVVGGKTQVIFGGRTAITFATQMVKTQKIQSERAFAEKMRGLQIYGFKTVEPTHLGKVGVVKGTL